jgi:two-component system NtrC family sensor kinase
MIRFSPHLHLGIRQKIITAFVLSLVAFNLIGVVAYKDLLTIKKKLRFVEVANNLHNTILEVRRYEKNYLLYGMEADHELAIDYLEQSRAIFQNIQLDTKGLKGIAQIGELEQEMSRYGQLFTGLATRGRAGIINSDQRQQRQAQLRDAGKKLIDLSLHLVNFEHKRIIDILNTLTRNLVCLLIVIFCWGIFLTVLVTRKVLSPLALIEETTVKIAGGDFTQLPASGSQDEADAVIGAFNKMVEELGKRQDQLVQARKLSSLGILTSGIAHQLNNPLNNISTSCQIAMEEINDGDKAYVGKLLVNIDQEVDRARDIVRGLLEFSRERDFQLSWVNLENLIMRTIQLVSSELPSAVDVTTDIPEDLDIYVDGQQMTEVFLNLLINAAQAMPEGKGHIHISAEKKPSVPEVVEIRVEDDGAGIDSEILPQIFDPFFSTKETGLGNGLGLSVVYGIIERHGGTITVDSQIGKGTVFTITLSVKSNGDAGQQRS